MNTKKAISAILLLFVIISIAYLVIKETDQDENTLRKNSVSSIAETMPLASEDTKSNISKETQHKVLVYYFYGNMRCPTCRKFETYAHEALQAAFPDELNSGALEWHLINVDEPSNEHFIQDYGITTRSLVIVDIRDGKQAQWKNLPKIWELVEDKPEFQRYVREEAQTYLEGSV